MTTLLKSARFDDIPDAAFEAGSQGARRATGDLASNAPDPEVAARAKPRQFSAAEKRRILDAADRCTKFGEIGALMRREGLYSSHLSNWRKQRTDRERVASAPPKRGPKPDPQARQIQHLNADLARVRRKLERAELIIDAQKKLCIALGLPTTDEEP